MFKLTKQATYLLVGILLISIFIFSNTFQNQFVEWDDWAYITENELLRDLSPKGIKAIFSTFYAGNYHPLTALSNAIDYHIFGLNPFGYHIGNLFFHLLNIALVFLLIKHLAKRVETAVICALFFAIHPMHVESVTWLSARKDVLYSFFFLLAIIQYIIYLYNYKNKYLYWALLLFLFSILSKPAAVVLPLLLLLVDYYAGRKDYRKMVVEKIPFFVLAIGAGIATIFAQKSTDAFRDVSASFNLVERFFLTTYSFAYYHLKAVLPFNLSALHPYPDRLTFVYYLSPLFLGLIIWIIYKSKNLKKELIFGFGFFLITIILVLHIPVGQAIVAERYTYLPYIGLFYILGQLYCYLTDKQKDAKNYWIGVMTIFAFVFALTTWNRNMVWKDSITLFDDMIKKNPTCGYAYVCRGDVLKNAGNYQQAEQDYSYCLQYAPALTFVYYNRGIARFYLQKYQEALQDLEKAAVDYPKNVELLHSRSNVKYVLKNYTGAIEDANSVLSIQPNSPLSYQTRASCSLALGKLDAALQDYTMAIRLKPDLLAAYVWRGKVKLQQQKTTEACIDWKTASQIGNNQEINDLISKYCR
jgi:tetratricopeptide (TPR) repeat protein